MKLVPLADLPLSAKLLVTCFLATLGFGNIAAGVYTQKYVGLSVESLVETYSERRDHPRKQSTPDMNGHLKEMNEHMKEMSEHLKKMNEFGELPITLDQIKEMPHKVDLKLLLQDAHVHLFSHGVLCLTMGILFFWSQLPEKWKIVLIPLPFLGGTLDFVGMFLIKFVADGFAYLVLFSGALMGIGFMVVFFLTLYELWIIPLRSK